MPHFLNTAWPPNRAASVGRQSPAVSGFAQIAGAAFLLTGLIFALFSQPALGQVGAGRVLRAADVTAELEYRLARDLSGADLWNAGYDFYRNYPRTQDTAAAIHYGFLKARGRTPEQKSILRKAAIYWEKVHDYGVTNVAVGRDENLRENPYWPDSTKQGTLAMRRPVGGPVPYRDAQGPARSHNRKPPYKGRADNPYPGPYYPGVYPP